MSAFQIAARILLNFTSVWIGLAAIFVLSLRFKRRLGLYGRLMDSRIGKIGLGIVLFWLLTAIFADAIVTAGPLEQISSMKNKLPGTPVPGTADQYYLLGGDNLARDVFSRMVMGSRTVLSIAPAATLFAYMAGFTLGLPAGYYGGRADAVLSFIANLVLAFPVILLFYLLVTPGIMETAVPFVMAGFFFLFPILFLLVLFYTGFRKQPVKCAVLLLLTLVIGGYVYAGLVFDLD